MQLTSESPLNKTSQLKINLKKFSDWNTNVATPFKIPTYIKNNGNGRKQQKKARSKLEARKRPTAVN